MLTATDLGLQYGGQPLFSHVDLQFTRGNSYGIIGANGAGKSTFLKILSGDLESTSGTGSILPYVRRSALKQDQNAYDAYNVMDTVIMGNQRLYVIGNDSGGFFANTYPILATGVACGRTVTFGRLVGKHLAKA